jgi:tetratricopeptide (TPR) repeat protein
MGMSEETANCTICRQPLGANGRCPHCDEDSHVWTIEDWRPLLTLALIIALGFSFTRLVVNGFDRRESALSLEFNAAGNRAMDERRYGQAAEDFESAVISSHGNVQYRMKLTDALAASGATSEALAQLHDFREQRPEDAQVNLKLARLKAKQQDVDAALRYYKDAIDGVWPDHSDPAPQKNAARMEAAQYLTGLGRKDESEGVLLDVAAALPANSAEQGRLAELFLANGDGMRALSIYQAQLGRNKSDEAALLGAAKASFAAGSYATARRYLEEVKAESAERAELRAKLERMEALDPFAKSATGAVRTGRTILAFHLAMDRLAGCGVPFAQKMTGKGKSVAAGEAAQWGGFARWAEQLAPLMSEAKLRGKDDVIESTMRFAFQAEMAAQKDCGKPTLDDEALLMLARERLGAGQ